MAAIFAYSATKCKHYCIQYDIYLMRIDMFGKCSDEREAFFGHAGERGDKANSE